MEQFLCLMTDTIKLYSWYQFEWQRPSFKVTVVWESNNFCVQFLTNFWMDLDEIKYAATTSCFVKVHGKFISLE